ncbi:uncharacterized protein LOC131855602 [Achroia grisella]|uniref:uncharacterized protein LOC131855602 n=1 Tax=Achroia grisella TaxID=688607 RepID=UPI0027D2DBC6|nr:uncharacterized protein LOC131855602 [Achroia grisella]
MQLKLLIWVLAAASASCSNIQFYRKDYKYYPNFDAHYKLHLLPNGVSSWNDAFFTCDQESSQLFYPEKPDEWTIVTNLTESALEMYNITDIYVGIHKDSIGEFLTVNGQSTPSSLQNELQVTNEELCVTMDIESGDLRTDHCFTHPDDSPKGFVCKKVEDVYCPTIDHSYIYYKETRKCYKVNQHSQTWWKASQTCFMEGGLLVVVESITEAQIVQSFLDSDLYFSGFRKIMPDSDFYTLKGSKVSENFFNRYSDENGMCGVISNRNSNLYTLSADCNSMKKFVCEMAVPN